MAGPSPSDVSTFAIILLAGSEFLSLAPGIKANGWIQLLLSALRGIATSKAKNSNPKQ
jgi:hypothetical protein